MAYNTRRGNNFMSPNKISPRQTSGKPLENSFISGGQLRQPVNPASKAPTPQGPAAEPLRNSKPEIVQEAKPLPNLVQQSQSFLNAQQSLPPFQNQVQPMESPKEGEKKQKPSWVKKDGKINKHERRRRQNERLKKILQPKNALMVLNELVGNAPCKVEETADHYDGALFNCVILVDGVEHLGKGKSKPAAKTAAAEIALKHMVLSKLKHPPSDGAMIIPPIPAQIPPESKDLAMETDEEITRGISWSHVASYALHKLLSSWDDGHILALDTSSDVPKTLEKKPAKKLPEKAASMNPTMLLNQMFPNVTYEEMCQAGNPPGSLYKMKCAVGDESFVGTGSTKKIARKMCAFAACKKVLGIEYSRQFLEEHHFNEISVASDPPSTQQPF